MTSQRPVRSAGSIVAAVAAREASAAEVAAAAVDALAGRPEDTGVPR